MIPYITYTRIAGSQNGTVGQTGYDPRPAPEASVIGIV